MIIENVPLTLNDHCVQLRDRSFCFLNTMMVRILCFTSQSLVRITEIACAEFFFLCQEVSVR